MSVKTVRKRIATVAVTALSAGLLSVVAAPSALANTALVLTAPAASRATVATAISTLGSTVNSVQLSDAQAELIKIVPGTLVQPTSGGLSENASFGGSAVTTTGSEPYVTAQVLAITPGAAGSYSMRMYADLDSDGVVDSNEPTGSVSWVTGGTPTQLIASQSAVSANLGSKVVITLTALDALNRRTLIVSGAGTVAASGADLLASITGLITVGVDASATVEAALATDGVSANGSTTSASTIQLTTAADGNGKLEVLTALPFAGVTNYGFAEGGAYDGVAAGTQNPAASYAALEGTYKFVVNTTTATGTITVQAGFGNTAANGTYTATATATPLTITIATVTTPADAESLGISSTQTLTDATASTVATTAAASLTTVKTASLESLSTGMRPVPITRRAIMALPLRQAL
jgi:hypothetical protein